MYYSISPKSSMPKIDFLEKSFLKFFKKSQHFSNLATTSYTSDYAFLENITLLSLLLNWVTFSCNAKLASSYKKEG